MAPKKQTADAPIEEAPMAEQPKAAKPGLQEFAMPADNTCAICGGEIKQGEPVFAKSLNQVVAGQGICKKCNG